MSLKHLFVQGSRIGKVPKLATYGRSTAMLATPQGHFHTSLPHARRPREDDVHEKPYSTPVFNQTYPPEAPTSDTIVPVSMLDAFNNMFDRGPNVGVEIITKNGFVLSNNVRVDSPIILLNGSAFMWNVPQGSRNPFENWNEDML